SLCRSADPYPLFHESKTRNLDFSRRGRVATPNRLGRVADVDCPWAKISECHGTRTKHSPFPNYHPRPDECIGRDPRLSFYFYRTREKLKIGVVHIVGTAAEMRVLGH